MLEAKIFLENFGQDVLGNLDQFPAFFANLLFLAAGSDLVVIIEVDVDYKLFGKRCVLEWDVLFWLVKE